jgi:hypothetical protein
MRRMRVLITLASAVLLSAGAGCATSSSAVASSSANRYLVTDEELVTLGDRSAYEALQQLRPSFLRSRDPQTPSHQSSTPIDVFVDGGKTEGIDALRTIRASTVKEMRFYEPAEANTRFGTGHNGGVIAVTLK